jgi:hypothetical protein
MVDRRRALAGALVIAAVIVIGVLAAATTRRPAVALDPSPEATFAASIGQAASGTPRISPFDSPTPVETPIPAGTPESTALATRKPTSTPRAGGDPRAAYAEFLLRANDDRSTVEALNRALTAGFEDQDRDAVRTASVNILDFVDSERDWLREHPPDACYADAHAAANTMLAAYGTVADRFIAWTNAAKGLDSVAAFGRALEAADAATKALDAFAAELEGTTCR